MKLNQISFKLIVLVIIFIWPAFQSRMPAQVPLLVETDMGGDSDDQASFIRLLLYSNQFDIKGVILSRNNANFQSDGAAENPSGATTTIEMAQDYITGNSITVTAPGNFSDGAEAHIILHVNDSGNPSLTRYRRIIIQAGACNFGID